MTRSVVAVVLGLASAACSQEGRPADWRALEGPVLTDHVQLTHRDRFVKAGEAYFNADASWIVFQAVPVPADGAAPDPFYSMYVAKLVRDASGKIAGIEPPILISPPGSANTCGWFHPKQPGQVLFGSTLVRPREERNPGFQVGGRKYVWLFPEETDVVIAVVPQLFADIAGKPAKADTVSVERLFELPRYQAECSYTRDGRFVLYASVRPSKAPPAPANDDGAAAKEEEKPDADIWVYDTKTGKHHALVTADGYDGGPFFSPDEKWICYRSDRKQDDLLQLFVAELKYEDGVPTGIAREVQLTDNGAVNWAPYWHPSGRYVIFGTSLVGHHNYEVFAAEVDPEKSPMEVRTRRITQAMGADVLPVFSPDGSHMMWTAQRGPMAEGEQRPSSQLWVARATDGLNPDRVFAAEGK